MAPYEFGILELIQGTFSTIFVIATIYIGHIFISRYFKHRNRNLYLFGFFWIGIAFVFILFPVQLFAIWFGVTVAFEPFFISIFGFLPVTSLSWLLATTDLLNLKNRINILRIYVVIAILFEILFFILFFMHPIASFIGIRTSLFDIDWTSFAQLYLLVFLSIDIVFGIKLGLSSMDSSDPCGPVYFFSLLLNSTTSSTLLRDFSVCSSAG